MPDSHAKLLSASISLLSRWLPSLWGQEKASQEKSIALSPASRTRLSYSLRYTHVQRKLCKMGMRKPTANTGEKYICMSFQRNSGRLLAWKAHSFRCSRRLRSDSLRSLMVTSARYSFLYHHFPMSFLRSLKCISPFFRVSPSFGLCTREGEHSGPCLAPVPCGHSWHGAGKERSCVLQSEEVSLHLR